MDTIIKWSYYVIGTMIKRHFVVIFGTKFYLE